jgi:hypothetical protein
MWYKYRGQVIDEDSLEGEEGYSYQICYMSYLRSSAFKSQEGIIKDILTLSGQEETNGCGRQCQTYAE